MIATITCIIAIGCSDENYPLRVTNRPPVIVKDSLNWVPNDTPIKPDFNYTFSVRAYDPDIGDTIRGFTWEFFDETGVSLSIHRDIPSPEVSQTFVGPIAESGALYTVSVFATDNRGANGAVETFTIPMAPRDEPSE
jgi:hypothetical protein